MAIATKQYSIIVFIFSLYHMTFKEYLAGLNQLLKKRPELANATVVYAADDEGNSFHEANCNGTVWKYDELSLSFITEDDESFDWVNAVCIN